MYKMGFEYRKWVREKARAVTRVETAKNGLGEGSKRGKRGRRGGARRERMCGWRGRSGERGGGEVELKSSALYELVFHY